MKCYALFDDGTWSEVHIQQMAISAHQSDLILVNCPHQDLYVKGSSHDGHYAAYFALQELKINWPSGRTSFIKRCWQNFSFKPLVPAGKRYHTLCKFTEERSIKAIGSSAGLAFALRFAQVIYYERTRKNLDFSIAATGALPKPEKHTRVGRIEGINSKLEAALKCLHKNDRLFVPKENEAEIDPKLAARLKANGIKLYAVDTVSAALGLIFNTRPLPFHKRNCRWLALSGASLLLLLMFFLFRWCCSPEPNCTEAAMTAFSHGEYNQGVTILQECLKRSISNEEKRPIQELLLQVNSPLNLEIYLNHRKGAGKAQGNGLLTICAGDSLRIRWSAGRNCYAYWLQIRPGNNLDVLFPHDHFDAARHLLLTGTLYHVPTDSGFFLVPPSWTGGQGEHIYIALPFRCATLENLLSNWMKSGTGTAPGSPDKVLNLLDRLAQQKSQGVQGIYILRQAVLFR